MHSRNVCRVNFAREFFRGVLHRVNFAREFSAGWGAFLRKFMRKFMRQIRKFMRVVLTPKSGPGGCPGQTKSRCKSEPSFAACLGRLSGPGRPLPARIRSNCPQGAVGCDAGRCRNPFAWRQGASTPRSSRQRGQGPGGKRLHQNRSTGTSTLTADRASAILLPSITQAFLQSQGRVNFWICCVRKFV